MVSRFLHPNTPLRFRWLTTASDMICFHLGWSPSGEQSSIAPPMATSSIRELKPFELLVVSCLLWGFSFVFHGNLSPMIIVTALAGLLIVPHGALDLALARELRWIKTSSVRLGFFLMMYTILAVSFWAIWPYAPTICLSIFWLLSVVHFGHNDTWNTSSTWIRRLSFLLCGTLPLVQSGFWHETEAMLLVNAMVPDSADVASHLLKLGGL